MFVFAALTDSSSLELSSSLSFGCDGFRFSSALFVEGSSAFPFDIVGAVAMDAASSASDGKDDVATPAASGAGDGAAQ